MESSTPAIGEALGRVPPGGLVDATLELHWAIQLIASAGQTFAEPARDDSHRAMVWDRDLTSFVGAPFAGAYPFRVAIRPEDLSFLILDRTGEAIATMALAGSPREEAYDWLSMAMATYLGGPPPIIERPEWDMPEHRVGSGTPFSGKIAQELGVLAHLYGTALDLIEEVTRGRADASAVRCWPHHFDIASLLTASRDENGLPTQTVGIGMAPMGAGYDTWYWYVSPHPYPEPGSLPGLVSGVWHTEGWTGAVLTGEQTVALPATDRAGAVRAFLRGGVEASLATLAALR